MRNIDKVKEMNTQELACLLDTNRCKLCAYSHKGSKTMCCDSNCHEGIAEWLDKEADITPEDINNEFKLHCSNYCEFLFKDCPFINTAECKILWFMENFNINDGKITRRD